MQLFSIPPVNLRMRPRTALVASADSSFRQRLAHQLAGLRWQVREVESGAQAWTEAETAAPDAIIVDSWLPDLDMSEFLSEFKESVSRSRSGNRRRRHHTGELCVVPIARNFSTHCTARRKRIRRCGMCPLRRTAPLRSRPGPPRHPSSICLLQVRIRRHLLFSLRGRPSPFSRAVPCPLPQSIPASACRSSWATPPACSTSAAGFGSWLRA